MCVAKRQYLFEILIARTILFEYFYLDRYDPHATQFISFNVMSDFISSLDPPLGIPKPNLLALVSFDLPIAKGDKIHCLDVLHSLTKYTLGFVDDGSEDFGKVSIKNNLQINNLINFGGCKSKVFCLSYVFIDVLCYIF